jgi:hypothetical protein
MKLVKVLRELGVTIDVEIAVALEDKDWIVAYLNSLDAHMHGHGHGQNANATATPGGVGSGKDDSHAHIQTHTHTHSHSHGHQSAHQQQQAAMALQQAEARKKHELCQTLLYACKYRWIALVQDLIEVYDVDLNHRFDKEYRNRAVDFVCTQGDSKLMSILLEYASHDREISSSSSAALSTGKFDLNESHPMCPSLIFTAIGRKHWDILKLILDKKPDLTKTHIGDKTPLHAFLLATDDVSLTASSSSSSTTGSVMTSSLRYEMVKQMLDQGASVLAIDAQGNTPLHYAARAGDEVAALILRAFINVKNHEGRSAIDYADDAGNEIYIFRATD